MKSLEKFMNEAKENLLILKDFDPWKLGMILMAAVSIVYLLTRHLS